ncbi:MAG: GNAT family N-acetyltransferase [Saprospiraceae bacterium]|nr:GNAT family N-acetyltransferase [Saprospiraceae bacterium]
MTYERTHESFLLSTDPAKIDLPTVHRYLSESSYWAKNIPFDVFRTSVQNALCFGIYENGRQAGFARVITDRATFGYIGDVFILDAYRGRGLSKWLMQCILEHPELQGFRRWLLATADAHGLYAQSGFHSLAKPDRWMELHNPNVYQP